MKKATAAKINADWAESWLDRVKDGTLTMSQRTVRSIEENSGMAAVRRIAKSKGVHLVQLTDDKGKELVAASKHPFKTIC